MNTVVKEARWTIDSCGEWLCLKMADHRDVILACELIKEKPCEVEIKHKRNKRSLDANAYAWVLFGKLAAVTGIPKKEVYQALIKDIGDNYTIVPIIEKAIDKWCENWAIRGDGWICEDLGECKKTKGYHNIMSYYGSSTYDSKQMSRLIDLAVEQCKEYGIEVMPPAELEALKGAWK